MSTPKIIEFDCSTQTQTVREMTAAEIAEIEAAAKESEKIRADQEAADAKTAADKASGNQKLKDLGLTDDEIAAITS